MRAGLQVDRVRVVISQPMLLPWSGMFEQLKLCSHFVFYDDVQLPLGGGRGRGFITRVQIKTDSGVQWLSLPVERAGHGKQLICEAELKPGSWRQEHLARIEQAYKGAPYFCRVFEEVVKPVYHFQTASVADFCMNSMQRIREALQLSPQVLISSALGAGRQQNPSARILAICQSLDAAEYISGWGAMNYIDYSLFEQSGIRVSYMDYRLREYPQLHGTFTPYVSSIDLLFNIGIEAAAHFIGSTAKYWRDWPHHLCGRPVARAS